MTPHITGPVIPCPACIEEAVAKAVAEEREACAKLADAESDRIESLARPCSCGDDVYHLAHRIRARRAAPTSGAKCMTPCPTCHHEARYHDDGRCYFDREGDGCACPLPNDRPATWAKDYWP